MNKYNCLFVILLLCSTGTFPANSISRWFSATYHDLRFTLHRYGHCIDGVSPIKYDNLNETDYLIHQMRSFLEQGNYDNEQLENITALMDNICRTGSEASYPISVNINVNKYNGSAGKDNRCRAIDEAMDSMYYVFKRAALNRSEPLDFSVIQFHPNATDKANFYNLTDLINTSWIKSEAILEHVCRITDSVKEYVKLRSSVSPAQKRGSERANVIGSMVEYLDYLLDPLLGLQKRLYWEGTNRLEQLSTRVSSGFSTIRGGIGKGYSSTRNRITGLFVSSGNSTTNSTSTNLSSRVPTPVGSMVNSTSATASTTSKPSVPSSSSVTSAPTVSSSSTSKPSSTV